MKIISKIVSTIITVCTLMILTVALALTVPGFFGYKPYIVLSGSMEPVIETGSIAYINTHKRDAKEGDIITYRLTGDEMGGYVTHRVLAENPDGTLTMKGDANEAEDLNHVDKQQVIGTYMCSIPKAGFIYQKYGKQKIIVFAAMIIFLNILSVVFERVVASEEEEEEENTNGDTAAENNETAETEVTQNSDKAVTENTIPAEGGSEN